MASPFVTPAMAGTHSPSDQSGNATNIWPSWVPAFAGMTGISA
jgi:hypothetical protein